MIQLNLVVNARTQPLLGQLARLAIGTSALAVSVNAFAKLISHARAGHVRWKVAFAFAATGVLGVERLANTRGALNLIVALAIIAVAILMLVRDLRG